jgi:hypothetical protein
VTLAAILLLFGATALLRVSGPLLHHRIALSEQAKSWLPLPAVALIAALAATSSVLAVGEFAGPARVTGVVVGSLAALARQPFIVVVVLAAVTTALLRLLGVP